jgi:hypothetical protein
MRDRDRDQSGEREREHQMSNGCARAPPQSREDERRSTYKGGLHNRQHSEGHHRLFSCASALPIAGALP